MSSHFKRAWVAVLVTVALVAGLNVNAETQPQKPLVIQSQGSFTAGGSVNTAPGTFDPKNSTLSAGQTYHGDHLYAFYQVPVHPRKYPIVMWHGAGQFSKTWETTADGREGFQNIFPRRGFSTYLIDQPRRGNAGRSMVDAASSVTGAALL